MDLGNDWFVDEADPDVGILADSIYHACSEDGQEATSDVRILDEVNPDFVAVITTYTCPDCGATYTLTEQEPKEWFV